MGYMYHTFVVFFHREWKFRVVFYGGDGKSAFPGSPAKVSCANRFTAAELW